MTARHRVSPVVICSPRALLDQPSYTFVDSALKDLKICSRRLRTVLTAYTDELQILERLYYKGKNQHRSGLFWQRVAEIRRYGGRLDGMRISSAVELFRCSFFGEASQQTPKSLKRPWTHFPDATYVSFVLERLSACCSLAEKIHERLLEASRCFALAMQSDILTLELQDVLRLTWSAAHRIRQTSERGEMPSQQTSVSIVTEPTISRQDIHSILFEDLGRSTHCQVVKMPIFTRELHPSRTAAEISIDNDVVMENPLNVAINSQPVVRVILERKAITNASGTVKTTATKAKKGGGDAAEQNKKVEQKRRKRDEIDDIFGS